MRKILYAFVLLSVTFCGLNAQEQAAPAKTGDLENFVRIDPKEISENPVSLFSKNWFVVSSGDAKKFNEMTVSWGALGYAWDQPTITVYIRSTNYTYQFVDKGKYFVLNSFDEKYRDKVLFIGTHTGRKIDKVKETGLTPRFTPTGNPYFEEAKLVIECEKIYYNDIVDSQLLVPQKKNPEPRRLFMGKIINVWKKK